jgi:hypothetical protein
MRRRSTPLTCDELAVIRQALDRIDMQTAVLTQQARSPRSAQRIAECLDGVRYLLDRAEQRLDVH